MNNNKILWTSSIFKWIQILLCIVPLFVPSWARGLNVKELKVQLFDKEVKQLEIELLNSLETAKNFFANKVVENAVLVTLLAANFIEYLQPIAGTAFVLRVFLAEESDWKTKFAKTIAKETRREDALNHVTMMESKVRVIQEKFNILNPSNKNEENRRTTASGFHTNLAEMLNLFAHQDSLFKKHPLIAAPVLIQLALLIAYFEPLAKSLVPREAMSPELSCRMRNTLIDYRSRAVNARLEKLHLDNTNDPWWVIRQTVFPEQLFKVMSIQYNQKGYNKAGTLNCLKVCVGMRMNLGDACLKDDFGKHTLYAPGYGSVCITDYAKFLRHRVEEVFPVELVSKLCKYPPLATGYGWLTIRLQAIRAFSKWDGAKCELMKRNPCDPFVKLFIDGRLELKTPFREDICCFDDVDVTHISRRISKKALIKIEVWDDDTGLFNLDPDLILRTEGNVDSFLKQGHRGITFQGGWTNSIETISFWQDEYKEDEHRFDDLIE